MEEKKYIFSVVIPIYNVESYLKETIDSVINQTIGFEDNIQLILVNDGSTDSSEEICLQYREKYPNNIIYIKQENSGVSSARNKGLEYAEGKYINFLDSDDIWCYDVFQKVYDFFEENQEQIDVVACRQKFFEGKEGYHKLDYKFEETQIVDIKEKYDYIQLSTASAFIKLDVMKNYKYDIRLEYSEDAVLIAQIIMVKCKYGILSEAVYNYRKRTQSKSALQLRNYKKSWYNETIDYGCNLLIQKSIEKFGEVIPYIQYQIMYDIQWRIKVDVSKYLSTDEKEQYIEKLKNLLKYINDDIIMEQKYIWKEYKIIALSIKYGRDVVKEFKYIDGKIYFNNLRIYRLSKSQSIKVKRIKIGFKSVKIKGTINLYLPKEEYDLYIKINNKAKKIKELTTFKTEESILGTLDHYKEFNLKIPLKEKETKLEFGIKYKGINNKLYMNYEIAQDQKDDEIVMKKWNKNLKGIKEQILIKKGKM